MKKLIWSSLNNLTKFIYDLILVLDILLLDILVFGILEPFS